MDDRILQINSIIPLGVKTILDIGSQDNSFFEDYSFLEDYRTTTLDLENADVIQDLNKDQKLKLSSRSYDLVVLSQILEHLNDVSQIVSEAKRVSKRYILVGLPNELTIDNRFRIFFGIPSWEGYKPYWHKHFFTIGSIENFITMFFGNYEKKYYLFGVKGGRFTPLFLRKWLANIFPSLMAKEVYYLIDLDKNVNNQK